MINAGMAGRVTLQWWQRLVHLFHKNKDSAKHKDTCGHCAVRYQAALTHLGTVFSAPKLEMLGNKIYGKTGLSWGMWDNEPPPDEWPEIIE